MTPLTPLSRHSLADRVLGHLGLVRGQVAEEADDAPQRRVVELGNVHSADGHGSVGSDELPVVAGEAVVGVTSPVRRNECPGN